jgi:hypothetical protein
MQRGPPYVLKSFPLTKSTDDTVRELIARHILSS